VFSFSIDRDSRTVFGSLGFDIETVTYCIVMILARYWDIEEQEPFDFIPCITNKRHSIAELQNDAYSKSAVFGVLFAIIKTDCFPNL